MSSVVISIGSNIGDRKLHCKSAVNEIAKFAKIVNTSSLYETEPVDNEDQPEFINLVVEIESNLSPRELLTRLKEIENNLGRVRDEKWGPRTIDLDIVFYDDLIINNDDLVIPHPRSHLRRFVLEPLYEILPDRIHPELNTSILELLNNLDDNKSVIKIENSTISQL